MFVNQSRLAPPQNAKEAWMGYSPSHQKNRAIHCAAHFGSCREAMLTVVQRLWVVFVVEALHAAAADTRTTSTIATERLANTPLAHHQPKSGCGCIEALESSEKG